MRKLLANPAVIVVACLVCGSGCIALEIVRPTVALWWVEAERDVERLERERVTQEAIQKGTPIDWSKVDTSKLGNLSTGPQPEQSPSPESSPADRAD